MIPSCDHLYHQIEKKMEEDQEGDVSLSLVECLRGRLTAERAASKAAKQDEQLMDSKLKELEAQLRDEIKARKRFEKKLNFLKKKLQSLKLPSNLEDSNSDSSCISSVASTDDPLQQEAIPISNNSSDQISQIEKESANSDTDSPRPKLQMEDHNEEDTSKSEVDDSMAMVPLSFHEDYSDAKEVVKITSENVRDVLGTLKNIREEIQRTMQRRQATTQMIQVG